MRHSKFLLNIFLCGLSNQYKNEMEYTESVLFTLRRIKVLKCQGVPGGEKNTVALTAIDGNYFMIFLLFQEIIFILEKNY